MDVKEQIFKKGSRTYYYSSMFFPKHIRKDVITLYAFVRTVDDYVDCVPQKKKEFYAIKKEVQDAIKGKTTGNSLVDDFVKLGQRKDFKIEWLHAFMSSMEFDLGDKIITTQKEYDKYVFGSAEVIGLFMANIMNVPQESHKYAQRLGKAMQQLNFIRDVKEDIEMNRWYLPLQESSLKKCDKEYLVSHEQEFNKFITKNIKQYYKDIAYAQKGFSYIPKPVRRPIQVATQMYSWTARQIEKDPMIVFKQQIKPKKRRIIMTFFKYLLR